MEDFPLYTRRQAYQQQDVASVLSVAPLKSAIL
jgi:hypothetical protein